MILPGNLIYIGTSLPGTKLYANSVLAVYVRLVLAFVCLHVDADVHRTTHDATHGRAA